MDTSSWRFFADNVWIGGHDPDNFAEELVAGYYFGELGNVITITKDSIRITNPELQKATRRYKGETFGISKDRNIVFSISDDRISGVPHFLNLSKGIISRVENIDNISNLENVYFSADNRWALITTKPSQDGSFTFHATLLELSEKFSPLNSSDAESSAIVTDETQIIEEDAPKHISSWDYDGNILFALVEEVQYLITCKSLDKRIDIAILPAVRMGELDFELEILDSIPVQNKPDLLRLSPDNRIFAVLIEDILYVYEVQSSIEIVQYKLEDISAIVDVVFGMDNTSIIITRDSGEIEQYQFAKYYLTDIAHDPLNATLFVAQNNLRKMHGERSGIETLRISAISRVVDGKLSPVFWSEKQIHALALAIDERQDINNEVFWIEGEGNIYKGDLGGTWRTLIVENAPSGRPGHWQIVVDVKRQFFYWTNGREIWRSSSKGWTLSETAQVYISHAISPYPIELAVDFTTGWLYWIDRDMEMIRRYQPDDRDDVKPIDDLYPAPLVREGLALDSATRHLFWNAYEKRLVEAAVIDGPGLFFWFEDRGLSALYDHQHVPAIKDWARFGSKLETPQVPQFGRFIPIQHLHNRVEEIYSLNEQIHQQITGSVSVITELVEKAAELGAIKSPLRDQTVSLQDTIVQRQKKILEVKQAFFDVLENNSDLATVNPIGIAAFFTWLRDMAKPIMQISIAINKAFPGDLSIIWEDVTEPSQITWEKIVYQMFVDISDQFSKVVGSQVSDSTKWSDHPLHDMDQVLNNYAEMSIGLDSLVILQPAAALLRPTVLALARMYEAIFEAYEFVNEFENRDVLEVPDADQSEKRIFHDIIERASFWMSIASKRTELNVIHVLNDAVGEENEQFKKVAGLLEIFKMYNQQNLMFSDEPFFRTYNASFIKVQSNIKHLLEVYRELQISLDLTDNKPIQQNVLTFDGQKTYASLGPLYLDLTDGFTFEVCFRSAVPELDNNQTLFEFSNGDNQDMLKVQLAPNSKIICDVAHEAGESYQRTTKLVPYLQQVWHYLAFVIDSSGIWRIYVDGEPVEWADSSVTKSLPFYAIASRPRSGLRTQCVLGRSVVTDSNEFFQGEISMMRCWNKALNAETISDHAYNPDQDFSESIGQYDRSLITHQSGPFLMRGHLDWGTKQGIEPEAQILHPMQSEGGLIVQSHLLQEQVGKLADRRELERKIKMAYTARLQAIERLKEARQLAAAEVAQAQQSEMTMLADARTTRDQKENQAADLIQQEQDDADVQRKAAKDQFEADRKSQAEQVEAKRQEAQRTRDDADTEVDSYKDKKHREESDILAPARADLKAAQKERSKYK